VLLEFANERLAAIDRYPASRVPKGCLMDLGGNVDLTAGGTIRVKGVGRQDGSTLQYGILMKELILYPTENPRVSILYPAEIFFSVASF
jgi:hypothetical protein